MPDISFAQFLEADFVPTRGEVETFPDGAEPSDPDTPIFKFMHLWKLEDLLRTRQLYFRRSDCFGGSECNRTSFRPSTNPDEDEQEGLPPEEYAHRPGLNLFDLNDIHERNHHLGDIACGRRAMYICSWYVAGEETADMWTRFAPDGGVAICSRYGLLKSVLEAVPFRRFLGLVRYGSAHLTGWNVLRFVSTKRYRFRREREVRAMLWVLDRSDGGNRHIDIDGTPQPRPIYGTLNPIGYRPTIDVTALVTEVIVSPYAAESRLAEVQQMLCSRGLSCPVRSSALRSSRITLPTADELKRFS